MPHNETRLWVGLAIAAIAIPAVGTFYYRSASNDVPAAPLTARSGPTAVGLGHPAYETRTIPVAQTASRNYLAEVQRAGGEASAPAEDQATDLDALDDEMFDLSPYDEADSTPTVVTREAPPDPATMMLSNPGETAPLATDDAVPTDAYGNAEINEPATDAVGQPILSDAAVFRAVVNNLNEADRDEFVRAYSAMTPAQRADLLDGFRDEMQNGDAQ